VIIRLLLAPAAVTTVLFPALVRALTGNAEEVKQLYRWGLGATLGLTYLPLLGLAVFAEDWMTIWLGAAFAVKSAEVAKWLLVGIFLSSLAQMPFATLQAAGRADVSAKLHLAQVVPYMLLAWLLIDRYGVLGAAWAWAIRSTVDAGLMFVAAKRVVVPLRLEATSRGVNAALIAFTAAMAPTLPLPSLGSRLGFFSAVAVVFCAYCYFRLVAPADREVAMRWVRSRFGAHRIT
jgi:O-antigen/teichoic acid export membrane protein